MAARWMGSRRVAIGAHRIPPAWYLTRACRLRHAQSGLLDRDALDDDLLLRLAVAAPAGSARRCDLGKYVKPADDGAERRVARRKRRVLVDEEELASVGIRARVGHRDGGRRVGGSCQVLVGERVS